jgi:hypothetical protein
LTSQSPSIDDSASDESQLVYVFVDDGHPVTVNNLRVGSFFSPVLTSIEDPEFLERYRASEVDFLPFIPNPNAVSALSPFTLNTINNYRVEYDAEVTRRHWYKDAPSRLTAVYAFERWEDCVTASARYGWPLRQVRRFRVALALRILQVNMEIVSLARQAYQRSMLDAAVVEYLWRSYWEGKMECVLELPAIDLVNREVVTALVLPELLIDGRLDVDRSWEPPSMGSFSIVR